MLKILSNWQDQLLSRLEPLSNSRIQSRTGVGVVLTLSHVASLSSSQRSNASGVNNRILLPCVLAIVNLPSGISSPFAKRNFSSSKGPMNKEAMTCLQCILLQKKKEEQKSPVFLMPKHDRVMCFHKWHWRVNRDRSGGMGIRGISEIRSLSSFHLADSLEGEESPRWNNFQMQSYPNSQILVSFHAHFPELLKKKREREKIAEFLKPQLSFWSLISRTQRRNMLAQSCNWLAAFQLLCRHMAGKRKIKIWLGWEMFCNSGPWFQSESNREASWKISTSKLRTWHIGCHIWVPLPFFFSGMYGETSCDRDDNILHKPDWIKLTLSELSFSILRVPCIKHANVDALLRDCM